MITRANVRASNVYVPLRRATSLTASYRIPRGLASRTRAAVVARVHDDAPVVLARDVVAVGKRGPDAGGIRVGEFEGRIEKPVVVGQVADTLDLRRDVVAGIGLVPGLDTGRALPAGSVRSPSTVIG